MNFKRHTEKFWKFGPQNDLDSKIPRINGAVFWKLLVRLKSAQIFINCLAGKPILLFGTFFSICIFLHDLKLFFPFLLPHTLRFYKFVCVVEISFKTCFFSVEVNPSICFHHPSLLIFLQILVIFFVSKIVRKGQNVPLDLGQSFFFVRV